MDNIIDFWKIKEIKNLKKLIQEKENLIKQYDLDLVEIHKTRNPTIEDFGNLNYKYKSKSLNRGYIDIFNRNIDFLKSDNSTTEEKYYYKGILINK